MYRCQHTVSAQPCLWTSRAKRKGYPYREMCCTNSHRGVRTLGGYGCELPRWVGIQRWRLAYILVRPVGVLLISGESGEERRGGVWVGRLEVFIAGRWMDGRISRSLGVVENVIGVMEGGEVFSSTHTRSKSRRTIVYVGNRGTWHGKCPHTEGVVVVRVCGGRGTLML